MRFATTKTSQLFLLLFFLMFAVIIGDNVSETLLLTFYSMEQLSMMFIVNAVGLLVISLLVMGAIDKISRMKLFTLLVISQSLFLIFVWFSIFIKFQAAYLILFSFAYIGKILLFLAFWTVANDLCDSREAKSIFPIIGSGGVLGGTIACFSTAYLVQTMGPSNLLIIWTVLLLISLYIMYKLNLNFKKELSFVKPHPQEKSNFAKAIKNDITLISKEPLLRSMSILYFLMFFLLISLDFHFFTTLKTSLTDLLHHKNAAMGISVAATSEAFKLNLSKDLSSFLGVFRGIANTITFFIQLTLAGYIFKKLGTAKSMFTMPFVFTFIFFVCLLQTKFSIFPEQHSFLPAPFNTPLFLIILIGTGLRIALFDSLFSPNFQIFFSSLPVNIRGRGKMFIEGLAKPIAIMLAGGSVLLAGHVLLRNNPHLIWIHFLILFVIGVALCLIVLVLQKGYTDSISLSLGGNKAAQIASVLKLKDWENNIHIVDLLIIQLFDPDEDLRLFSIEILSQLESEKATKALHKALKLTAYKQRPEIIRALGRNDKISESKKDLESWLWDKDPMVLAAAIDSTLSLPFNERETIIQPYIHHKSNIISIKAISVLWEECDDLLKKSIHKKIQHILETGSPKEIEFLMEVLSNYSDENLFTYITRGHEVLKKKGNSNYANNLYIECLSRMPKASSIPNVFNFLEDKSELYQKTIFENLSHNIGLIEPNLKTWLVDFNEIQKKHFLEFLFKLKYRAPKSVRKVFRKLMDEYIESFFKLALEIEVLQKNQSKEAELFTHAVIEGPLETCKFIISNLIAMAEPGGNLYYVTPRLFSTDKYQKTTAMEAIETVLHRELHQKISMIYLETDFKIIGKFARNTLNLKSTSFEQILEHYLHNETFKWSMACALFYQISTKVHEKTDIQKKELHNLLMKE